MVDDGACSSGCHDQTDERGAALALPKVLHNSQLNLYKNIKMEEIAKS
jgi:hypothetical protein